MNLADAIRNRTQSSYSSTIVDLKDFKKFVGNDRKFSGIDNPIEAEKWLMGMEKEFDALRIPEEKKVQFATYMFEGEAEHWWRSIKRMHDVNNMCWLKFEELFLGKYFSPTARASMSDEFPTLRQGSMTVTQLVGHSVNFMDHILPQ